MTESVLYKQYYFNLLIKIKTAIYKYIYSSINRQTNIIPHHLYPSTINKYRYTSLTFSKHYNFTNKQYDTSTGFNKELCRQ